MKPDESLCGVEVAVHRAAVLVTGRIACLDAENIDIGSIVREVYASAGYGDRWRAGNFAVGGPEADNGLSGKKLAVDAYGPRVPIGGGALSAAKTSSKQIA